MHDSKSLKNSEFIEFLSVKLADAKPHNKEVPGDAFQRRKAQGSDIFVDYDHNEDRDEDIAHEQDIGIIGPEELDKFPIQVCFSAVPGQQF